MSYENILVLLAVLYNTGILSDAPYATVEHAEISPIISTVPSHASVSALAPTVPEDRATLTTHISDAVPYDVPYYSQLRDITVPSWSTRGCGIASLAMLIEYYKHSHVDVNALLRQGIDAGAYITDKGWGYAGLIALGAEHGISGVSHDLAAFSLDAAFSQFSAALEKGPVMASVHYTFDVKNPIPHLVIVTGVTGDRLYYNDPAKGSAGDSIPISQFKSSWKKRYLEFWPIS